MTDQSTDTTESLPPGSDEALEAGCKCPVLDNNHGHGQYGIEGRYVIGFDCPLHGSQLTEEEHNGN